MAQQIIDTTTPQPNGKIGDTAKVAFGKVNDNFTELFGSLGAVNDNLTELFGSLDALDTRVTANEGAITALGADVQAQIDALAAGQAAGQKVYRTWAELSGVTGSAGVGAQVIDDTGTHTDPVVGGTVPNAGQYVWSESPAGWRWVRPDGLALKADKADVDQLATRPGPGLTDLFAHPNVFTDREFTEWTAAGPTGSEFRKFSGATLSQVTASDGRPAMRYQAAAASSVTNSTLWRVPLARLGVDIGDAVSASVRIVSGTVVGSLRVMLRQVDAAGTEISAARVAVTFPAGPIAGVLVPLGPAVVANDAAMLEVYFDASAGTDVVVADVMLAKGKVTDYRPPLSGLITETNLADKAGAVIAENAIESVLAPNLVHLSSFTMEELSPVISSVAVADAVDGIRAWRLDWPGTGGEVGQRLGPFAAGSFHSGKVSASVSIVKLEPASTGTARVILMQFDADGVEISGARQTKNITTGGGAVNSEAAIVFDGVPLDAGCASVQLYIGNIGGSGAPRSLWFRNPSVYDGSYKGIRVPAATSGGAAASVVYVSPGGDDGNAGTAASPKATFTAAINAIGGNGTVFVLPGVYGSAARFNPSVVKGRVEIVGVRDGFAGGDYAFPVVNLGIKVEGITKTSGRTKVYQATVSGLPALSDFNWCYEHGTPDADSEIIDHRQPQHRGRTHRLPWFTRIRKTTATTLNDALDEIDASPEPKAFIDSGVLYFSIASGGDATGSDIYVDASQGMIPTANGDRGDYGQLVIRGLTVMHAGVDLRAFKYAEVDELVVAGARANCVDYNVLRYGTLEVCCAGSASGDLGDGLNGHSGAVLFGEGDLYAHDCRDDGFSDHEGCTTRMTGGGLVEYNGGGGITPAYGADTVVHNMVSVRNQRIPGRKHGAFYVTGAPSSGGPPESGVDTRALFIGCVDHESDTSFADDYTRSSGATPAHAVCIGCKSIKPTTRGFNVSEVLDCGFDAGGGSATAKNSATVVKNTALVT